MHGGSGDPLDQLLEEYDRRKQEETRTLVAKAHRLEEDRRQGAELLRESVVPYFQTAASRIVEAGHQVGVDKMLDAYPPAIRLHIWVKPGPLEDIEPRARFSLEFVWGEPTRGLMCVKRWSSSGLGKLTHQGQCEPGVLDSTWVREQLHLFMRHALAR